MLRKSLSLIITISMFILMLVIAQTVFADSISINSTRSKVRYGRKVTISGLTTPASADKNIILQRSINNGKSYSTLLTGTTDASGQYSFTFVPVKSGLYKVLLKDINQSSSYIKITVVPKMSIRRPRKSWVGQRVRVYGRFSPYLRGRIVTLQRYVKHRWRNIKRVRSDKKGIYKFYVTLNSEGTYTFRVKYAGESLFYRTTTHKFKIKTKWRNPFKISTKYKNYIVVKKSTFKLYYLLYGKVVKSWNTGVGMPAHRTPSGNFKITAKRYHPTWYNPNSSWSKNMPSSISWPNSPFGERALNLNVSGIRIHGTDQPWLLDRPYRAVSHGCIRLKNPDIIWLYNRVTIGTNVKIL